jgi:2-amino-4-hydroxy-6-hydroxymethyldihydropteridine diphosphokinase
MVGCLVIGMTRSGRYTFAVTATAPILITLGSNIDPAVNLARAIALLAGRLAVRAVSPVYETAPAAGASGPAFLNAAVLVDTDLPPAALKFEVLRAIEADLGRVRVADKNAPRTIDLDLALYGDRVIDDPAGGLVIPDPDILRWLHVALPLADLAPDFVHPVDGRTLGEIAAAMSG